MPIEYKVYGCKFKCGTKHSKSLEGVVEHESKCWYNPKNKTCMTCKYGKLVNDSCDHPELPENPVERWRYRDCSESHCQDIEFKENSHKEKIVPNVKCEFWKLKV